MSVIGPPRSTDNQPGTAQDCAPLNVKKTSFLNTQRHLVKIYQIYSSWIYRKEYP